jgi:hypothetical protein
MSKFSPEEAIEGISGFRPPQGDNIDPPLFLKGGGYLFHENRFDGELERLRDPFIRSRNPWMTLKDGNPALTVQSADNGHPADIPVGESA